MLASLGWRFCGVYKYAIARRVHWSLPKMNVFHLLMNFVVMLDSRPDYSPAANSGAVVAPHNI